MMKSVSTTHQKQTVDFLFIFLHQSLLFQAPLDRFFSSYSMLGILVNFLGHPRQCELPKTQGLLVYLSLYEKFQYDKIHEQVFINSIYNPGNPGSLNRIFLYLLNSYLKAASSFSSSFQSLQLVMNRKVNYGLIKSKVQIKRRNATRCNKCHDLLHLSFTLKISVFLEAYTKPSRTYAMELLLRK